MANEGQDYSLDKYNRPRIRLLQLEKNVWEKNAAKDGSFRTLGRWKLETFALDNLPKYVAMSYQWEPDRFAEAGLKFIFLNGFRFPIRFNLALLLHSLRRREYEDFDQAGSHCINAEKYSKNAVRGQYYWIDAICINQNDLNERSYQVSIMGNIFKRAEHVCIWIAPYISPNCNTDLGIDLVKEAAKEMPEKWQIHDRQLLKDWLATKILDISLFPAWKGLAKIAQNSYWTRGWIIQEVVLAWDVYILCGSKRASGDALIVLLSGLIDYAIFSATVRHQDIPEAKRELIQSIHPIFYDAYEVLHARECHDPDAHKRLLEVVTAFGSKETTDPRDMIYAFQGLASTPPGSQSLDADYRSPWQQVFIRAATHMIETSGRLDVLNFAGPSTELPSWVPDFARQQKGDNSRNQDWKSAHLALSYTIQSFSLSHITPAPRWWMPCSLHPPLSDLASFPQESILATVVTPITTYLIPITPKIKSGTKSQHEFLHENLVSVIDFTTNEVMHVLSLKSPISERKVACMRRYSMRMWASFIDLVRNRSIFPSEFLHSCLIPLLEHKNKSIEDLTRWQQGSLEDILNPNVHRFCLAALPVPPFSFIEDFKRNMGEEHEDTHALDEEDWRAMEQVECLPALTMYRPLEGDVREGDQLTMIPFCSLGIILRPESPTNASDGQPRRMKVISEAYVYGTSNADVLEQLPRSEIHIV